MLGQHLAELYGVRVKAPYQAMQRNRDRFPEDSALLHQTQLMFPQPAGFPESCPEGTTEISRG
jgi:hypothetical protein